MLIRTGSTGSNWIVMDSHGARGIHVNVIKPVRSLTIMFCLFKIIWKLQTNLPLLAKTPPMISMWYLPLLCLTCIPIEKFPHTRRYNPLRGLFCSFCGGLRPLAEACFVLQDSTFAHSRLFVFNSKLNIYIYFFLSHTSFHHY